MLVSPWGSGLSSFGRRFGAEPNERTTLRSYFVRTSVPTVGTQKGVYRYTKGGLSVLKRGFEYRLSVLKRGFEYRLSVLKQCFVGCVHRSCPSKRMSR